jgi:hypothetical protein
MLHERQIADYERHRSYFCSAHARVPICRFCGRGSFDGHLSSWHERMRPLDGADTGTYGDHRAWLVRYADLSLPGGRRAEVFGEGYRARSISAPARLVVSLYATWRRPSMN